MKRHNSSFMNLINRWTSKTNFACDYIAAGDVNGALTLLNSQIGAISFEPLKPYCQAIWTATHSSIPPIIPFTPSLVLGVQQLSHPDESVRSYPSACIKLPALIDTVKNAYKLFSQNLTASLASFEVILRQIPLLRPEKSEVSALNIDDDNNNTNATQYKLIYNYSIMLVSSAG
jgi:hypothetical protein